MEKQMEKKTSVIIIAIVLIIFAGIAVYSNHRANNIDTAVDRESAIEDVLSRPDITINTKYQYKDGAHTFLGTLEAPTPCHQVSHEILKGDEITEIALMSSNSGDSCGQVITEKQFRVTFTGPQDESIIATLNGEIVNLNVFEIDPEDDIDLAEIFIKG